MKKIIVLLPFLLFRIISNSQSSLVVNNKLIENKILIKEDFFGLFATIAAIWLAGWALKKIGIEPYQSKVSQAGLSNRVGDALDDIYKDEELVKDVIKKIKLERGLE